MRKPFSIIHEDYKPLKSKDEKSPIDYHTKFTGDTFELSSLCEQLRDMIIKGESYLIQELLSQLLETNIDPLRILNIVSDAMNTVGQRFSTRELFIADLWMAARCVELIKNTIEPLVKAQGLDTDREKIVMGTVEGDVHSIGPKIVELFLEGAGYDVINLGVDISPDQFIEAIKQHQPVFVGLSAWLDTTANFSLKQTIQALDQLRSEYQFKIIVGGPSVTRKFAKEIGADGYGNNAEEAVQVVTQLKENCYSWEFPYDE
ncbi:MAG: B12-binding domain-containing protein [Promethearchaeota archaeon]